MKSTRKIQIDIPYDECDWCKTIKDCPHPTVAEDGMGTPIPPDECPRGMEIIKATREYIKLNNLHHINPS